MANKKKRKKRLKRQLIKVTKQLTKPVKEVVPTKDEVLQDSEKPWLNPAVIDSGKATPPTGLYLGKYRKHNHRYQLMLNKKYGGSVQPIERFINFNANILHYCDQCGQEWYSKPRLLLTKDNQKHVCGINTALHDPKKSLKKLTEDDKIRICLMAENGLTATKIANKFGISRTAVITHLRKAGLK